METKPEPERRRGFPIDPWGRPVNISAIMNDEVVQQLWQKMYQQPVIIRCSHCNSHNVISSATCIQCGAPLGDYRKIRE